jgi:hypothetical protein
MDIQYITCDKWTILLLQRSHIKLTLIGDFLLLINPIYHFFIQFLNKRFEFFFDDVLLHAIV